MTERDLSISVIMPAFKAEGLLPKVLPPLLALLDRGEIAELLVVDDQSPDGTADLARQMGASVMTTPENGGPGAARNLAAKTAKGAILWFVDSDVIAREDGPTHIRRAFEDPNVGAMFGSYDTEPEGQAWFSRYKNLVHHFYHQTPNDNASTFWAGCGAIDKEVFLALDGFDIETYKVPSIEDIELGYRISGAGRRIVLDPEMQCKHLKVWEVWNSVQTDIFKRALPWSRLMIGREGVTNELNTGNAEKLKAVVAGLLVLSILALPFTLSLWWVTALLAGLAILLNLDLARFLTRHGGLGFAAKCMAYHQFYYIYSAATFAFALFEFHILGRKTPGAITKKLA
jgi:glycosyltransferase involved in cell wall biosynthesis